MATPSPADSTPDPSAELAVVILAAGQGTRMKSRKPKVLHELAGIPLVGHVLATADELGASHIVAVVRHERDAVAAVITEQHPATIIVDQDDIPGTGRAVELALGGLPTGFAGTVVVLSADVPLLDAGTVRGLIDSHIHAGNGATLLSAHLSDPTGFGRIIRSSGARSNGAVEGIGAFEGIVEQKDATAEQLTVSEINAGVYAFDAAALTAALAQIGTDNAQSEKYLTDAAAGIRAAGRSIEAVPVADPWLVAGINDRVQLAAAAAELNARIVRGWQLAGVTVQEPATTWIDLKAVLAEDVELLPGTQILGATVIERGAVVGPHTTLRHCEIGENAVVNRTDATLAVIGANATVGPFSYLRANTVLGEDGKIGAFVETKNSQIGRGTKVPHLSYIGDATIGEYSNIGAGSITSNYDGVNKTRTTIGDHVRGSSNTVYVAPVTIGDGAYTGAGAVVRKDVPAGALAISVAPQRNMLGWAEQKRPGSAAAIAAAAAADSSE
ncbi:bifunctional UDP-N-acetylglucosamine diphosphorylase/glucosamine-1-phosphate N-acetyltransferase GlmU [Lacisediminihabitans changchengi]|uniref:Bifunctional protein GlmU n=1 Tax=Lacisediminihabitans changchengi TaxID=2787634 RepID=A0A934W1T4_9MICO|nr:bifunctional UDP-N-acetylglucosamine diphosphorylase/glucosamine-1-phosphate N-acetyltransferase GlmU [Lacisediminihabitans changchengi]MBK4347208.1 bifunctional UDP-N-acetylglucosamine diphosphorylase/glucosamine-1-phosphate N-acetyltransferase GlmU [Lacisediminihabitans changchengi]